MIGVQSTDWSEPLISPAEDAVKQFFLLFERGFNHYGRLVEPWEAPEG